MPEINLGGLMATLYEEFLTVYQDEELAAVATAAAIETILADHKWDQTHELTCVA